MKWHYMYLINNTLIFGKTIQQILDLQKMCIKKRELT